MKNEEKSEKKLKKTKKIEQIPEKDKKLTPKQERFCQEYVLDFNGTQAAIRAGYKSTTANEQSSQNLAKLNIKERIKELKQEITERNKLKVDDVIAELKAIGFSRLKRVVKWDSRSSNLIKSDEISETDHAAIAEISCKSVEYLMDDKQVTDNRYKVKMHNKLPALIKLGEYLGMFNTDEGAKSSVSARTAEKLKDRINNIKRRREEAENHESTLKASINNPSATEN